MKIIISRGVQVLLDLLILGLACCAGYLFRFEFDLPLKYAKQLVLATPYVALLQYAALVVFRVPSCSWRHVGMPEVVRILAAVSSSIVVLGTLRLVLANPEGYAEFAVMPLGVLAMDGVLAFLGVAGVRVLHRMRTERNERAGGKQGTIRQKRVLLVGAGRAGVMVAKEIAQRPNLGMTIVGFVDDDPAKRSVIFSGVRVLGNTTEIPKLSATHEVEQVILTMATAEPKVIRRLLDICESASLPVKTIPRVDEILEGRVNLTKLREVRVEDLLGRETVELDTDVLESFLKGKRVLVTGAGGSIGSGLCRQVARFAPDQLIMLDQYENGLFAIHSELRRVAHAPNIACAVADICDAKRIDLIFSTYKPHVIFHAAAHKHVPMMERNPGEAIKNNVFGTQTVADAADRHDAQAFVMISTDKAVNPTSVMGATKRVAETYIQAIAKRSETNFVAVRFGNVLGSAGSVIPLFRQQIKDGGPITVTHPEMRRYFMTIPEACQLVMQAAAMGHSGEILVLDMGTPVAVLDLAREMIRLSGLTEEEIPIEFVGMRPGEKLFEELGTEGENMTKTRHPRIFVGQIPSYSYEDVARKLELLAGVSDSMSLTTVRDALRQVVPELLEQTDPSIQPKTRTHAELAATGDAAGALPNGVEQKRTSPPVAIAR